MRWASSVFRSFFWFVCLKTIGEITDQYILVSGFFLKPVIGFPILRVFKSLVPQVTELESVYIIKVQEIGHV